MRSCAIIALALLLIPTAVIIAGAEDGEAEITPKYTVSFAYQGVASQKVRTVEDVKIPEVDGVLCWVVTDIVRHDHDTRFAIVNVSEVWAYWSAHNELTEDITLRPITGPYILVDDVHEDKDRGPIVAGAVGGILGAVAGVCAVLVLIRRGIITPSFKSAR